MTLRVSFLLLISLALTSCKAYRLDSAQHSLRRTFAHQNYEESVDLLLEQEENKVYREKDKVLLNLELGTANHFAGRYDSSNAHFTTAEEEIDYLYTKSISRAIKSFVFNDNTLAYDGEDYEDIYLNIFKTLNYIQLNELESALVESRRIAFKLGQLDLKYNDLVDALSKADTTEYTPWRKGTTNVQNSALGRYLSAILFAKTNKLDDARIEYEHLLRALQEQSGIHSFQTPSTSKLQQITRPRTYNVLVTGFSGRAPRKFQNDFRLYLDEPDLYLKFSFPSLKMYQSQVDRVEVMINDETVKEADLIEEMDVVAREVYKVKEPIIYARSFVRAFLKSVGSKKISKGISEKNGSLGGLSRVLGIIGQEATEKADLRSWQTMPGKAYATVLDLPEGKHEIKTNYYGNGQLLYSETQSVNVGSQHSLELVETLYWN